MPQKPLLKAGKTIGKKATVANKHGKGSSTRKGQFSKPPKGGAEKQRYLENKELSKVINRTNESNLAAVAENKGGKLKALKGKPPALATKDAAAKAKVAKVSQRQPADMSEDEC